MYIKKKNANIPSASSHLPHPSVWSRHEGHQAAYGEGGEPARSVWTGRRPGTRAAPGSSRAPQARPLPAEPLHPETAPFTSPRRQQGGPRHVFESVHVLQRDRYLHRLTGDPLDDVMAVGVRAAALGLGLVPWRHRFPQPDHSPLSSCKRPAFTHVAVPILEADSSPAGPCLLRDRSQAADTSAGLFLPILS